MDCVRELRLMMFVSIADCGELFGKVVELNELLNVVLVLTGVVELPFPEMFETVLLFGIVDIVVTCEFNIEVLASVDKEVIVLGEPFVE